MLLYPNQGLHVVVYVLHLCGDQFVITGDRTTNNYSPQHVGDGGTNVTMVGGSPPGPVTIAGAHGSAIGSQTASGANSRVMVSQEAKADHCTVIAGRDAISTTGTKGQRAHDGWWVRLRKRGMVVALATIISAIAAVAGTAIAACAWIGWTP